MLALPPIPENQELDLASKMYATHSNSSLHGQQAKHLGLQSIISGKCAQVPLLCIAPEPARQIEHAEMSLFIINPAIQTE